MFGVLAQAHAAMNCYWVSVSVPAQFAESLPSGVIGPDGSWIDRCAAAPVATFALARLDTTDPTFAVPLEKARPWRRLAREGTIYRERTIVR